MAVRILINAPENDGTLVPKTDETYEGGQPAVINSSGNLEVATPTVIATHIFLEDSAFVASHRGGSGNTSVAGIQSMRVRFYSGTKKRGGKDDADSDAAPFETTDGWASGGGDKLFISANGKWTLTKYGTTVPQNFFYGKTRSYDSTNGVLEVDMFPPIPFADDAG